MRFFWAALMALPVSVVFYSAASALSDGPPSGVPPTVPAPKDSAAAGGHQASPPSAPASATSEPKPADAKPADAKLAEPKPAESKPAAVTAAKPAGGEKSPAIVASPPAAPAQSGATQPGATPPAAPPKTVASAPAAPAKPAEKLPPRKGSHIKDDDNSCLQCHTNADLWDPKDKVQYKFFLNMDGLKKDVHFQKGVSCIDCHGGDPTILEPKAHQAGGEFRSKLPEIIAARCAFCHEGEWTDLNKSVHANAAPTDDPRRGTTLTCDRCHGPLDHRLLPVKDVKSPVHQANQIQVCGGCHSDKQDNRLESYLQSVHGKALTEKGLSEAAPVCANCHSAHLICRSADERSTLHISHVADTCAACHQGIKEQLQKSVHNRGTGLGGKADRAAPGSNGKVFQLPSCTSCHRGHALSSPESVVFRESEPGSCGNCHLGMSSLYALSMHGKLTNLGYGPAAKCADCHGLGPEKPGGPRRRHEILAVDDPKSSLSPENRRQTCGQCHTGAGANFVHFSPHIDSYDAEKNPVVNAVQITLLTLLYSTFAFFGVHSLLWFIRGMVEVLRHGRAPGLRPGATAYVRFVSYHRIGHTIVMTAFLGLALTGLPIKYNKFDWAKSLAHYLGGFEMTGFLHRFFGVILLIAMLAYLARLVRLMIQGRLQGRSLGNLIFGPDSPVPNLTDLKDFLKMLRWFFGLGPKPGLDRWSYWEKIDFWGAIADTVIIGSTGLMLWFPSFFCGPLPGTALNIAAVVHSTQALLATGFVFAIHFFNTHFRPDKFPADLAVLSGLVSEEEFKEERPVYFQRLEREGKLAAMRTTSPGLFVLLAIRTFGFVALAIGLALLLGMVVAALG
jgi:cytochrome b subunit of formate dehydrogenase